MSQLISKFLRPCLELLYDVIWALRGGVALKWSPYDVTQQHYDSLKCGVRRMTPKCLEQFYMSRNIIIYHHISIHLLCIFLSFKQCQSFNRASCSFTTKYHMKSRVGCMSAARQKLKYFISSGVWLQTRFILPNCVKAVDHGYCGNISVKYNITS